ncbi:LacI family DNA-binding transcriptional regulator [Anaeromicropila populeti]|uniref:LacI family transcriptional regulator n=1 Tax=Anaeromicropila populeti TaxID=37658 RepID=A0A1I6IFZ7_9FIRM|nr:LacI family DNA-binding transcriptional regulator [Anaeromicropila populeti]SFR65603.1 LacI family transcriptional regulator [Anaeromicropila populeti]
MSKITMQDIADALHISRITVWKVFNNKSGVSEALKKQILDKAEEMGYTKRISDMPDSASDSCSSVQQESVTVSVVVARPESSAFWMKIIHQIAKELDAQEINLMYTYLPSTIPSDYTLPNILTGNALHGIIVLNVYDSTLLSLLNQLPLPKVFLDYTPPLPTNTLSGDLILLEGRSKIYEITKKLIVSGIEDIGFIGDTEYAITNQQRYEGFLDAMNEYSLNVEHEHCLTKRIGIYTYEEEITNFLQNNKNLPKAYVCVSDFVAHFVLKYLTKHKYRVPEDIIITGFDGNAEYPEITGRLTTVEVETTALGSRLTNQLLYRISHPTAPTAVIYVNTQIVQGESALL